MSPVLHVVCCTVLLILVTHGEDRLVSCSSSSPETLSTAWRAQDYPNPLTQWEQCGRNRSSYLCDPDRILPDEDAAILDSLLFNLTMETICPCGNRTHCSRWTTDFLTLSNDTESCNGSAVTTSCDSCQDCSSGGKVLNCSSCSCSGSCDAVTSGCHDDSRVCLGLADRGEGYVMTVALMRRMTLITKKYRETVDLAANRFADHFRDSWKFGRCGEAIVVVISMDEQQIYTSTEETAGQRLSDLDLVHLYRDYVTEDFWTGNITQRLPVLIEQFIVLINTPDPPRSLFDVWLESWGNWFLLALVCATIASCIVYKQRLRLYKKFPACCQKRWLKLKNKGRKNNAAAEKAEDDEVLMYEDTIRCMREEELQIRKNRQGFTW